MGSDRRQMPNQHQAGRGLARARILVIDDEPLMGETLTLALRGTHEVVVATSGSEGLELITTDGAFDLVLCDLMMPDLSGEAVFHRAIAARPDIEHRFVFITGGAYTSAAESFLSQTGLRRLEKPFRIHDVEALLDRDDLASKRVSHL